MERGSGQIAIIARLTISRNDAGYDCIRSLLLDGFCFDVVSSQ